MYPKPVAKLPLSSVTMLGVCRRNGFPVAALRRGWSNELDNCNSRWIRIIVKERENQRDAQPKRSLRQGVCRTKAECGGASRDTSPGDVPLCRVPKKAAKQWELAAGQRTKHQPRFLGLVNGSAVA